MIRYKKLFTVGSIVSMSIMFVTLMLAFIDESFRSSHVEYNYYWDYYYTSYYTSYRSFPGWYGEWYWPLFAFSVIYISLGIVAIALYKKRIKAINIVNLICTAIEYMFALIVAFVALDIGFEGFPIALIVAICIAFPFHLVVEIFALIAQKYKNKTNNQGYAPYYAYNQQAYAPQQNYYPAPNQQPYAPQQNYYAAPNQQPYAPQQNYYAAPNQQNYAPQQNYYATPNQQNYAPQQSYYVAPNQQPYAPQQNYYAAPNQQPFATQQSSYADSNTPETYSENNNI